MSWITTATGRAFDLAHPRPEMIDIADIAHALSNVCRFTGHCREFYSVAQHSIMVADLLPPRLQLAGLLHDATEAYLNDLSSPAKAMLPDYQALEAHIWREIADRFELPDALPSLVKQADLVALATEKRDLLPFRPEPWPCLDGIEALPERVTPMTPTEARKAFLRRYSQLISIPA